ncbi:phage tail protein I [Gorillibacterium massiliense]|uniref:phage tail protein I n=1 Tax=Gorillibacterium massiliense TaxID=1280390 RepID=UPI0004B8920B|nr:phage tail protein I [Gorillibacterium massiliense]
MDLTNLNLLQLQSKFMQRDEAVEGMSTAIGKQLRDIVSSVDKSLIYGRINDLPEEALDILAWQFGAEWYDANVSLETKRKAINDVLYLAQIRGTPAAVKRVIEIYFGDGHIEEWFEYSGEPYYFRVVTNNDSVTNEQASLFIKATDSVKNLRSKLAAVVIQSTESCDLKIGISLHMADKLTIGMV